MMESSTRKQLRILLMKALDGVLEKAQWQELESLLILDPEARQHYFELLEITKAMRDASSMSESQLEVAEGLPSIDEAMLRVLAELEKTAPSVCEPSVPGDSVSSEKVISGIVEKSRVSAPASRFWLGIVKWAVAACIGLVIFAWLNPGPPLPMCLVASAYDAVWEDADRSLRAGDVVFDQDKPRFLKSGILKLAFEQQTEAIIEGPARFSCNKDNSLSLETGKVCAYVPHAENGFEVLTPNSRILDLGTEFGVDVENDTLGSKVQVFQGEVSLKTTAQSKTMTAGHAQRIIPSSRRIDEAFFETESFVRYVNRQGDFIWRGQALDLVDLVANGDGFGSGMPDMGISVLTGDSGTYQGLGQLQQGRDQYLEVSGNPFVDGVFVPMHPGQVVSSTALSFDRCPQTSGYFSRGVIRCGARYQGVLSSNIPNHSFRLGGISYHTRKRPALDIPANTGMTFDLDQIRSTLQGVVMDAFVATCGLSETFFDYRFAMQQGGLEVEEPCADFFVLLDGQVAFEGRDLSPSHGGQDIDLKIGPDHHFLTLIVTEGRDRQFLYDWALFAEPRIRLQRQ